MSKVKTKGRKGRKPVKALINNNAGCVFCFTNDNDELISGKLLSSNDLSAHYYCMLFSSALHQGGAKDTDGLLGFLPKDIAREVLRGKRLRCHVCKKKGATIGCCVKTCRKVFHYPCSLKGQSLHHFYGNFETFCLQHVPSGILCKQKRKPGVNANCCICLTPVDFSNQLDAMVPPCCSNGVFHKLCIQKQAIVSGFYFFKCPLCNNKEDFKKYFLDRGIYIPEQDAAWELEQGAFQDLYERHSTCDAIKCFCPEGRTKDVDNTQWEVVLCKDCGSEGCHIGCGEVTLDKPIWQCANCRTIIDNLEAKKKKATPPRLSPCRRSPRKSPTKGKSLPIMRKRLTRTKEFCDQSPSRNYPSILGTPSTSAESTNRFREKTGVEQRRLKTLRSAKTLDLDILDMLNLEEDQQSVFDNSVENARFADIVANCASVSETVSCPSSSSVCNTRENEKVSSKDKLEKRLRWSKSPRACPKSKKKRQKIILKTIQMSFIETSESSSDDDDLEVSPPLLRLVEIIPRSPVEKPPEMDLGEGAENPQDPGFNSDVMPDLISIQLRTDSSSFKETSPTAGSLSPASSVEILDEILPKMPSPSKKMTALIMEKRADSANSSYSTSSVNMHHQQTTLLNFFQGKNKPEPPSLQINKKTVSPIKRSRKRNHRNIKPNDGNLLKYFNYVPVPNSNSFLLKAKE